MRGREVVELAAELTEIVPLVTEEHRVIAIMLRFLADENFNNGILPLN